MISSSLASACYTSMAHLMRMGRSLRYIYIYTNRYDTLVAGLRMLYLYGALVGHTLTYADVCYRSGATWRCFCWSLLSRACSNVS
jgi:hypothetical protein